MAYSTSTLAQGCFGKVYKQKYNDTWAAIKKVPQQLINRKDLERECDVYNKLNHPNIVKLLGNINLKDGKWVIPLEFIFGEDLETTIFKASKSKIQLTPSNRGTIIIGMCEGLQHLHSKDIVHQDLKPENVMVEHDTNRAVIIDLGLAKFFRRGLNSAIDMGNEAYSAPEVLQKGSQRDQRSDVWAMGKIITELCARIRLYTPSVCPAKIKDTLHDQPYCHAVCRMVEPDPSLRASMGGVISEIRRAGGAGTVTNAPTQQDHLKPPSANVNARNRSPSPRNRDPSPQRRDPSPFKRDPSPFKRDPSPFHRDPSPLNRAPSPFNRDPSPLNRAPLPFNRDPSPLNRAPSPFHRDPSPLNRAPSPFHRDPSPFKQDPSPLKWERSPRPDPTAHRPSPPVLRRTEDKDKNQALVPTGGGELTQGLMKMRLYQEAAMDLPCNLPTTGRVVVRRFEEKNGEVETWEQKEVVTRDGKIVKFDNVKFNSN
ncbi:dual specificity testis-specific protein kinase 1 [Hippoglossus stenolepis]|uniref:dual specificity testis-specific protein kinase 1 n=1 Tax=Hippoglossus stenolepis TaxID=195615 RepID=UPI001FAF42EC|nr:dual specificity testis-specific protein kinase 1 [Hippoglossus stenolepis]XP_035020735.2 dual specificity testis-specific protein kinase 1 [Hippoglossus stenolepis]XP_035020736.2 dual specificity testis-specific protein kinase 1 [Hippoglossus stenolepis]